ncbi:hypothetical protein TRFO_20926 [Tritrichomonas foetus]|uniref:Exportin-T n=1 Tax=Tritrichomonas foetus TaxID=1144522 RepID=A0A1J4KKW1_9EUKA|nr:hypothetical protein TRFO_20926 [Tritrichomonas foetus]|eukprot:OHT10013.1 hypothetical protein TRFO_20926 [Tritrichomonas foetus]
MNFIQFHCFLIHSIEKSLKSHFRSEVHYYIPYQMSLLFLWRPFKEKKMEFSQDDIARIEGEAAHFSTHGKFPENGILISFQNNPNSFAHCQFLIENSANYHVIMVVAEILFGILGADSPVWDNANLTNLMNWIPDVIQRKADFIFTLNVPVQSSIINGLSRIYGKILLRVWTPTTKLSDCFNHIMQTMQGDDPPHQVLRCLFFSGVIGQINDFTGIKQKVINDKTDTSLFDLFKLMASVLIQPGLHVKVLSATTDLLAIVLDFFKKTTENKKQNDDILLEICDLPHHFLEIISDPNFITTLFNLILQSPNINDSDYIQVSKNVLQISYFLCSLKTSYFPRKNILVGVLIPFCGQITALIQYLSSPQQHGVNESHFNIILHSITLLLYKFSRLIDTEVASTTTTLKDLFLIIAQLTNSLLNDNNQDSFFNRIQSIIFLMKFWTKVSRIVGDNVIPVSQFYTTYVNKLVQLTTTKSEEMNEMLHLEHLKICDAINIVPLMLRDFNGLGENLLQLADQARGFYKSSIDQSDEEKLSINDVTLTTAFLLLAAGLVNPYATRTSAAGSDGITAFESRAMEFIFDILSYTQGILPQLLQSGHICIEFAIYIFSGTFPRTSFAHINLFKSADLRERFIGAFNTIISRLSSELQILTTPDLIRGNLIAIRKLLTYRDIIQPIENVRPILFISAGFEFTAAAISGQFPFSQNPQFKREIILMMQICTNMITKVPEKIEEFFSRFNKFALFDQNSNPNAIMVFLFELLGIFSIDFDEAKQQLMYFFNWLFPDNLKKLAEIAAQFFKVENTESNPILESAFLKIFYKFCFMLRQIDWIPKHSPNGIILFSISAAILLPYFQRASIYPPTTDASLYPDKLKPLKYAMLLMSEIFGSEKIMYGAFELYKDATLEVILKEFADLIQKLSVNEIFGHPKVAISFTQLLKSLTSFHLNSICTNNQKFFIFIFNILITAIDQFDIDVINNSVETGKNLGTFLQNNKELVQGEIAEFIKILVKKGFVLFVTNPNSNIKEYSLLNMVKELLPFMPEFLPTLLQIIAPHCPPERANDFNKIGQDLTKGQLDISKFDEFRRIMSFLKKIIEDAHLLALLNF